MLRKSGNLQYTDGRTLRGDRGITGMTQVLLDALKEGLVKKSSLLDDIMDATELQSDALALSPADMDMFDRQVEKKEKYLEELIKLDTGFDAVYNKAKDDIALNRLKYEPQLKELQKLIADITDKSVKLRAREQNNRQAFEMYVSSKRKEIKNFKLSSRTVSNYYKSMADRPQGQSYFMDKKK